MKLRDIFNRLVAFDSLPNKAEQYNVLLKLIDDYKQVRSQFTQPEYDFVTYILAERCYSQGYEMSYSKAYESSPYCVLFFKIAFELVAEVLDETDKRYIQYRETAQ